MLLSCQIMAKVRWGVLGCASFARRRTIPAMLEAPSVELVGVASRSPDKAESFRSQFSLPRAYQSYEEMLDDPEIQAIYNPLPNGLHGYWMMRAAEKGKHTLCEKPFEIGKHTSELQSHHDLVCRLLLEKKKNLT